MRVRFGHVVAGLVVACVMLILGAPATGAAGISVETPQASPSVETPQGHESEDEVALSPSSEAQMSHASIKKTAAAAARARADTAGDPGEVGRWGPVEEWPVVPIWAALLPDGKVLAYASVGTKATESFAEQKKRKRPSGIPRPAPDERHARRRLQHLLQRPGSR